MEAPSHLLKLFEKCNKPIRPISSQLIAQRKIIKRSDIMLTVNLV